MSSEKVTSFEKHVNFNLRPKIRKLQIYRDKVIEEQSEYRRLFETMEKFISTGRKGNMRTKADLGNNFYCDAEIDNCELVAVNLGHGVFLELTQVEARDYCKKKEELLEAKVSALTEEICEAKAEVRFVLEGVRELNQMAAEPEAKKKSIFNF